MYAKSMVEKKRNEDIIEKVKLLYDDEIGVPKASIQAAMAGDARALSILGDTCQACLCRIV